LLLLSEPIKRKKYPLLIPNFSQKGRDVSVCGYGQNYQVIHSNPLLFKEDGGRYDIDTEAGQSGAPVFFMEGVREKEECHLVGLHKGY